MRRFILVLWMILLPATAWDATYYVDPDCTDTNPASATVDGTEYNPATLSCTGGSASYYVTIADVNLKSFAAGDFVYFKKGETWREQLTVPSSGSAGNPITFGAYGSGAKPIIRGDNVVTPGTSWAAYVSDWTTVFSTTTKQNDWNGGIPLTSRSAIPANVVAVTGAKVRLTLHSHNTSESTFNKVNIGVMTTGDTLDAAPTTITFDGGSASVTMADNTTKVSDEINFTYDPTKRHGITVYLADDHFHNYSLGDGNFVHYNCYGDEATTLDLPTTQTITDRSAAVIKMEIQGSTPNVWTTALTTEPKIVFFDGTIGNKKMSIGACTSARDWFWASDVLYVYGASDPDTLYTAPGIEPVVRDYGIYSNTKDYISIDGFELKNVNKSIMFVGTSNVLYKYSLKNNTIHGAYNSGISMGLGGEAGVIEITGNTIYDTCIEPVLSGSWGIIVLESGSATNARDTTLDISYNTIYNTNIYIAPGEDSGNHDAMWIGTGTPTIAHNTIYNTNHGIIVGKDTRTAIVRYNIAHDLYDSPLYITEVDTGNGPHNVYYNLFYNAYDDCMDSRVSTNFYNNVCDNVYDIGINMRIGTFNVKNNIINRVNQGTAPHEDGGYAINAITGTTVTISNNALGAERANFIRWDNTVYSTYANWETAYGGSTSSVKADPLFVSTVTPDFRLKSGSPAINVGVDVSLTTDYAGNTVPFDDAVDLPDIGAYEWGYGIPILTSPADAATDVGWPVNFVWEVFPTATLYHLQVDDDADFSSPEIDEDALDPGTYCDASYCTFSVAAETSLLYSTQYFWHVRALVP